MDRASKRYISSVITRQSEGEAGLERDSTTDPTPVVPRSQTETVIKGDIPTLPAAACEAHNGLARAQNSNLSPLTSETMWYQPILIEHLVVLLLLQQHTHFSSSRRVSMWTLVVENVVDADIYETRDCSKSSSEPFEKFMLQIVREIRILVPKLFVSLVQKFGERGPKIKKRKKRILFVPFFERLRSHMGSRTYRAQKLMKECGEEWERKGFTTAVGWVLVEEGGYVLVVHITADRMTCVSKSSDLI